MKKSSLLFFILLSTLFISSAKAMKDWSIADAMLGRDDSRSPSTPIKSRSQEKKVNEDKFDEYSKAARDKDPVAISCMIKIGIQFQMEGNRTEASRWFKAAEPLRLEWLNSKPVL